MSLRKHVENFAQHTSMHGFGRIILTKKPEKRVAWVIVFVSAWALFAFQLTRVLTMYFEYSKKTTTEFKAGGAPFPAVTLCNMQSVDFHVIFKFLKKMDKSNSVADGPLFRSVGNDSSFAYHFHLLKGVLDRYMENNVKPDLDLSEFRAMFSRTSFAANLPKDLLKEISIKEQEFIVKCTYGNAGCNFTEIKDPYFLKCFTFDPTNRRNRSIEDFQSLPEGMSNGLSVTLFTGIKITDDKIGRLFIPGVYETGNPLSGSSGIRVVIHPPGTEPYPFTEGYDVPPGFQASMGIVPEKRKRLGPPYGLCAKKNRYKTNYLYKYYGVEIEEPRHFRKISCERMCMQQQVMKECKCVDDTLPSTGNAYCFNDNSCWLISEKNTRSQDLGGQDVHTCRSIEAMEECAVNDSLNAAMVAATLENIRCADSVIERLMTNLEALSKCNCYAPCEEFRYHVSYSLAKWPSTGYEGGSVFREIFRIKNFTNRFEDDKKEMYEKYVSRLGGLRALEEFAKINVYISDSDVLDIVEEPAMTITQLISDVGGQLGIWIGVSVITISEVLETIMTMATAGFRRLYRKFIGRVTDSDLNDPSPKTDEEENKAAV